jgi:hypothetical protein
MNQESTTTENHLITNWKRALLGGLVGTVVFTLMGKFVAPQVIANQWTWRHY